MLDEDVNADAPTVSSLRAKDICFGKIQKKEFLGGTRPLSAAVGRRFA